MATSTEGGTTTSLNNTPQAQDDFYTAKEDEVLYFSVMANDLGGNAKVLWSIDDTSDDGSTDLVAKDVAGVCEYSELGAKISLTSDGRIKYDTTLLDGLAEGQTVTDQFTYAIRMSNGTLSWATVTVTLTGTNDGPVAVDDSASVNEDASTSGNVGTNDSDVDNGAILSYALVDPAPTGLTFNPDGSWSFDASSYDSLAENELLVLTIPYTVTDEHGASDTGELRITITGTNDGPVANVDSESTSENSVLTADVLANDTDADNGAVLTVTTASAPAGQGTASVVGNQVQFDPGTDFDYLAVGESTEVVVNYTIEDEHGASSSSTLTITVTGTNDGPDAVADSDTTDEDNSILVDVLGNDTDPDASDVLTISDADVTGGLGSVAIESGQLRYDPGSAYNYLAVGESEQVEITYSISDGNGGTDTATLTITVTGTNDGPDAVADSDTTDEDNSILVDVLGNDTDPDASDVLTISDADVTGGLGSVAIESGQLRYDPGSAYNYLAVDESEQVEITYSISDGNGGTDTATLTITVTGTNDGPELTAAQAVLAAGIEDTPYNVTTAQLLTGFSDPDSSDVLAVFGLTADHGTVVQNLDGSYTIQPEADYNGPVVLSYSVIDGNGGSLPAMLSFNLATVNDAAVISGTTSGSVLEATPADPGTPTAMGTLLASDVDNPPDTFIAQGSTVTASGYGSFTMSAGGVWTYTLNNGNAAVNALATGMFLIDTFTVQSADGTTQTITVTIDGATDAIVVTPPTTETGADPNDFDNLLAGSAIAGGPVTNTGSNGGETIHGSNSSSADNLSGDNGGDQIYGHDGGDNINGQNGADMSLYGQAGNDTITGGSGADQIFGGSGVDTIYGNEPPAGNATGDAGDTIYGGSGNDFIYGQLGNDLIIGGYGADTLTGNAGNDTFRYLSTLDTNDIITDFMTGDDQIDLLLIDAIPGGADDAFAWGGTTPTANGLWYSYDAGTNTTTLYGDTDGNAATAEFMLTLQDYSGFNPFSNPLTPPPDISY